MPLVRNALPWIVLLLSGFSGLAAEVAWIRRASLAFGSTTYASSTVLAVFLLGLALGSLTFGRLSRRVARPLRVAAAIEVGIGALVLISPELFALADDVYGGFYRRASDQPALLVLVRAGLIAALLLPPTFLMGGTLPLFCRHFAEARARVARVVGRLYGVNTLGAAIGCTAAGFLLLPALGLSTTLRVAAAANVACALLLRFVATRPAAAVDATDPVDPRSGPAGPPGAAVVSLLAFATGFVALGGEVLWIRYLGLLVGNTVRTYTTVLAVVLLGVVLGSLLAARFGDAAKRRALWFGAFQVAGGLWTLALMLQPPDALRGLASPLAADFALLLVPTALSGASFPLLVRLLEPSVRDVGRVTGRVTAQNIVGGVLGSLAVGFLGIPGLGLEKCLFALCGISLATGFAAWFALDSHRPRRGRVVAALAAIATAVALPASLDTRLPADLLGDRAELVAFREGSAASLAVLEKDGVRRLEIDRWWQGEDRKSHQVMAAHLPMLLHPDAERVVVVGVGTGQTPSRFLLHDVRALDCVDVEPALFEFVSEQFESSWMDDPRVRVLADDGRDYLLHSDATYDVVSLEVGQPFRPGVAHFYTADFYLRARERLGPSGLLVQFVPLPFFTVDEFRRVLASFRVALPTCALFYNTSELLLVGTIGRELSLSRESLARLDDPTVHADLAFSHWGGAERHLNRGPVLLATFLCGRRGVERLAADAPPLRDDRPVLDQATREVRSSDRRELAILPLLRDCLDPFDAVLAFTPSEEERRESAALREWNLAEIEMSVRVREAEAMRARGDHRAVMRTMRDVLARFPEHRRARRFVAESLLLTGDAAAAQAEFDAMVAGDTGDGLAWYGAGLARHQLGEVDAAIARYRTAIERTPRHADAWNNLGTALAQLGRLTDAIEPFEQAVRLRPGFSDAIRNLQQARRALGR